MMKDIQILPDVGSDHFPVYGKFQYQPSATLMQEEPEADKDDNQEALDKIAKSDPNKEVVAQKY